jgi:long-subunit fatty acid transport protein
VIDQTQVVLRPDPFTRTAVATETRRRDWDDTLSARLGLEGDVADHWMLSGGVAWEPSPVPGETLEPGFPRGDALVYAIGFSYHLPKVAFDLGYSFHQLDDREVTGLEAANPRVTSIFESRNQVWSFSASWRW